MILIGEFFSFFVIRVFIIPQLHIYRDDINNNKTAQNYAADG